MSFFLCLVLQSSATENGQYDYTRSGNPTRDALERFFFFLLVCIMLMKQFSQVLEGQPWSFLLASSSF